MTRGQLLMLPPALALAVIYDCLDEATIAAIAAKEPPSVPKQPLFDLALYGRDGVSFASECDLSQLDWHAGRAKTSAESGGQYAEKDAKKLEKLKEWRFWRAVNPTAIWVGKRGDTENVIAAPPSGRPASYARTGNGGGPNQGAQESGEAEFT